jgi:acetolactate synthase-1/2/3 large subunit
MAQTLAERGVQYVFGLPGGEIMAFIDACRRAGLQFFLTGHEASAAWMAQVVGEIGGVPGVCASTLGPGATNLCTGVANAFLDRAPLLAVTADIPERSFATMTHQRIALNALFSPITKRSVRIGEGDPGEIVAECLATASAPRPGPVHVSLANDVAVREFAHNGSAPKISSEPKPRSSSAIREIAARLDSSERPIILVGLGARPVDAAAIRLLVDTLAAPFLVTPKAKGILSEDSPLFLGVASGMAIDKDIVETIRTADLVLGIGFDPVECDKTWFMELPILALDSASMAEGDYNPREAVGSISALVAELTGAISGPKPWPSTILESRREAIRRSPLELVNCVSPLRLTECLRSLFPRDGIVTCDVGSHKLLMGQFWKSFEPGTFFMSNGLSGMGLGLPAAMAAQIMHKDKPVMAVVGDGGMLMMLHDLTLLRELGLPVITIVLVDRSLSLIRVSAERRGLSPYGTDFTPPDFAAVARAFGICGKRAGTLDQVKEAVEGALTSRTPLVLDVAVDYREYYDLV